MSSSDRDRAGMAQLAGVFLRLGATGFGGPAAHMALMRTEIVGRRGWISDQVFLDLVAASNLIPGPNSTEVAMHVGHRLGGRRGLVIAGCCFIAPAFVTVLALAVLYQQHGRTPTFGWIMAGITPVILAILLDALWQFSGAAVRGVHHALVAVAAAGAAFFGVHELAVLGVAAGVMAATPTEPRHGPACAALIAGGGSLAASSTLLAATATTAAPFSLAGLTWFFLKVGSVLFGSGYVLIAFLQADLVDRWSWLTAQQLLDAIAVGQVTPGPLFTTATFVGYVLAGVPGAVVATVAIFAPAFVLVALTAPHIDRLRNWRRLSLILDGAVLASLGLMAAASAALAVESLTTVPRLALCAAAFIVLRLIRPNTVWLILGGAVVGWLAG